MPRGLSFQDLFSHDPEAKVLQELPAKAPLSTEPYGCIAEPSVLKQTFLEQLLPQPSPGLRKQDLGSVPQHTL